MISRTGAQIRGDVFIKPNLCARAPRRGENTPADFMGTLLDVLHDYRCNVAIGHTSLLGAPSQVCSFDTVLAVSGFSRFMQRRSVDLVNLDTEEHVRVPIGALVFEIPRLVLECPFYLNVAKLKTHMQTTVSLALKNQMGIIAPHNRVQMHRLGLEEYIARLATVIRPKLSIIEGIVAMEGNGPHHGGVRRANLLLASQDIVELDSAAASVMNIDPCSVAHIRQAADFGVGTLADQRTLGDLRHSVPPFALPAPYITRGLTLRVWPTSGCPRCYLALQSAANDMKRTTQGRMRLLSATLFRRTDIIYGTCKGMDRSMLSKHVLGFGRCAKEFCESHDIPHCDGCPLSTPDAVAFLTRGI
jgi:uncharacterized protein (DUF362 family)